MEIEAKYSVLDPETTQALEALSEIVGFDVVPGETRQIVDTYLDTPDHALMAAGYACRRRQSGGTSRINLKGLGSSDGTVHRREELALTIDEADLTTPQAWPKGAARKTVLDIGQGQALTVLFEVHQTRTIRYLEDSRRGRIAELSLDQLELRGGKWQQSVTELEVELLDAGVEADLEAITKALVRQPGLVPQPTSKFERGMGLAYRYSGIGAELDLGNVQKGDTIGEATRKTLRPLFLRMQLHEQGTYLGHDPEELHDMRVMTRRMRTAFRIAEPYLVREEVERTQKGLRETARLLGAVRDMDVFRQKTETLAAEIGIAPEALSSLTDVWNVEYTRRRNELLTYLNSRGYGRFKQGFWAKLDSGLPEQDPPAPVHEVVHRTIIRQLDTLLTQERAVAQPKAPLSAYHQLRIDVKDLRYTLMFFQALLGREAEQALPALEMLQDYYGELQDAVVAVMHLRAVAQYGTWEMPLQSDALWQAPHASPMDQTVTSGLRTVLEAREMEIDSLLTAATETMRTFHASDVPGLIRAAVKKL